MSGGHVEKRGPGRWRARYRGPDGRERSRTFDRRVDAERWLRAEVGSLDRGAWVDPRAGRVTVGELGTRLLTTKGDRNTRAWYSAMLRHVGARWEHVPIGSVRHVEVQAWVGDLATSHGPDTVRGAFKALHELVALAVRAQLIGHDPCAGVRLPKVERREMLALTGPQVHHLAEALEAGRPGHGWGTLVRFAAYSGCRAGEIGALRVGDLDLLRHRVRIAGARKTYGEDGPTKTGRVRWVALPRQLCDELAAHLAPRPHGPADRVWTGDQGGALSHKWFYAQRFVPVVDDLTERGVLPVVDTGSGRRHRLRFHDLRHTCVALLIAQGAQVYEVMHHLGHTSVNTTVNTYGHWFPEVQDRIRTALEETWAAAAG